MMELDGMSTTELVDYLNQSDVRPQQAVARVTSELVQATTLLVDRLSRGGRVLAVGAGTSGRLAALDASELPPTYGVDPQLWQVAMAGGPEAFLAAREGAEDDREAGRAVIATYQMTDNDVILGVAASGKTPFVLAALQEARHRRIATIAISCTGDSPMAQIVDVSIAADVGNEPVRGSTRMLAGTTQKMILNILSTVTMIQLGHVLGDYMIDMKASNAKLRSRAQQMVVQILGVSDRVARDLLVAEDFSVRRAIIRHCTALSGRALTEYMQHNSRTIRSLVEDANQVPD